MTRAWLVLGVLAVAAPAHAEPHVAPAVAAGSCYQALDALGVSYRRTHRRGIALAVEVTGPLGGVDYRGYDRGALVLDCSLVFSLARAGQFLLAADVARATYSSAYQRRNIRGTHRPSKHSFGLALDVHSFAGAGTALVVRDDYEQGLGDTTDCVGAPLTRAGSVLRSLACELDHSGLFRIVLTPDYDQDHYNHFHLEARPWPARADRDPQGSLDAGWAAVEPPPATTTAAAE